jgi:hypothetical protein
MNAGGFHRIVCRRLPPTVTEEQFRSLACVKILLDADLATLQFYTADLIGDTAAPSSATAIITLFAPADARSFIAQLSALRFPHPLHPSPVAPLVELAPLQRLPQPPQGPVQPPAKPPAPIEEDPEFMQFAKDYELRHVPPTDALMSPEDFGQDGFEIDDTGVLDFLNDRMGQGEPPRKRGRGGRRRRGN